MERLQIYTLVDGRENALTPLRSALHILCGPGRKGLVGTCGYLDWVSSMQICRIRAIGIWESTRLPWKTIVQIYKLRVLGKIVDMDQSSFSLS